jgi:hypothetical protein
VVKPNCGKTDKTQLNNNTFEVIVNNEENINTSVYTYNILFYA